MLDEWFDFEVRQRLKGRCTLIDRKKFLSDSIDEICPEWGVVRQPFDVRW